MIFFMILKIHHVSSYWAFYLSPNFSLPPWGALLDAPEKLLLHPTLNQNFKVSLSVFCFYRLHNLYTLYGLRDP